MSHGISNMAAPSEPAYVYLTRALRRLLVDDRTVLPSLASTEIQHLFELVHENKVYPLFRRSCKAEYESLSYFSAAAANSSDTLRRNGRIIHMLYQVDQALASADIDRLFYKGPLQQLVLYGSPYEKDCSDGDVLVDAKDFDRAVATLQGIGFEITPECKTDWWRNWLGEQHLFRRDVNGLSIDLHKRLQQPGSPQPKRLRSFLDGCELVPLGDRKLPVPNIDHIALIASMNLVKGLQGRHPALGHAFDLLAALKKIGPSHISRLRAEARRQGLDRTLMVAYTIASQTLDVTIAGWHQVSLAVPARHASKLVIAPSAPDVSAPRRRTMLASLCDNRLVDIPVESIRWFFAERSRTQALAAKQRS